MLANTGTSAEGVLADTGMVGDPYLWVIGPIVVFLALAGWLAVTLKASRKRERPADEDPGLPNRGAVTGGIIQGSPSQRNRRDAAPTAAEREAAEREAEARDKAARAAAARASIERQAAATRTPPSAPARKHRRLGSRKPHRPGSHRAH